MRCSQLVRSSISVLRRRVLVRHSRTCAGGIHASGNRPSASSVRNQRASARSVLAWRFLPRNALVSAGSAKCATTPASAKTSYTNNQPVHASNATSMCSPANCLTQSPTASRSARNRPRRTSPVSVFSASNVICARCTSNPARIAIRGLLCSSEIPHRESLASSGGGPDRKRPVPKGSCHLVDDSDTSCRTAPRGGRRSTARGRELGARGAPRLRLGGGRAGGHATPSELATDRDLTRDANDDADLDAIRSRPALWQRPKSKPAGG